MKKYEDFENVFKEDMQGELVYAIPSGNISNEYCRGEMYDRNYGGRELFVVNVYHDAKKCGGVYKRITVLYRSGYYGGLNIDYHVEEDIDCMYNNCKPSKVLDKKVDVLCNKIKKIIKSYGTPLRRVAVLSNGEAIYEKEKLAL